MNMKLRNIPFSPPDMGGEEVRMAEEAILSGWITTGPKTKEFEQLIAMCCQTKKAVCLNSATACMEMALRLLGIGPGDEVIVPAYTYTASASVTQHVGATLVLVDAQQDCVEMDFDKMAAAITERTKAVLPVDLAGIVCDYDKVFAAVESKKHLFRPKNEIQKALGRVAVLADAAHAFGAQKKLMGDGLKVKGGIDGGKMRMCGEIADFTSFSFHAVKNLTTAEGGALTWHLPFGEELAVIDKDSTVPPIDGETWNQFLYRLSQLYSLHGQNKDALAKTKLGAWEYDIIGPWYKCNMTDIMAGIGLAQLKRYPELLVRRREIINRYNEGLKDCNVAVLNHYDANHNSSGHLYWVRLLGKTREETNKVIEMMAARGIATNVHYKPLPMMTAYKALGFDIKDYPNAYHLFENEITLPLHTRLTDEDVEYVIGNFIECVKVIEG